jgi:preprotein translocase subunit SecG
LAQIVLVIHLLIAVALVAVVLIQRSEGGGLGIGGGGGGGVMSVRGTANLLTRITAVLAACFMATSLTLAILAGAHSRPEGLVQESPAMNPGAVERPADGAPAETAPTPPDEAPDLGSLPD